MATKFIRIHFMSEKYYVRRPLLVMDDTHIHSLADAFQAALADAAERDGSKGWY